MLTRIKNFVATGLATQGRLYAGDLNAIQDAVAAQSDYAQTVDISTLRIGDSTIALFKYGSGEVRLTGAARFDAIVRALGGLYAGQFTTTQRDAIAPGLRPYGLVIWNSTNSRLEANRGSDATPDWKPVGGIVVEKNGASPVSEGGINLIEGSGITLTVADNPGTGYVDVTIAAPPAGVAGTIPIGGGIDYYGASDPTNFLICDGRSLLRSGGSPSYAALFAVIGTQFGAVDSTHFNIPDTRGRVTVGVNTKVGLAGNEGISNPNSRSPQHYHLYSAPLTPHGGYTETGENPGATLNTGQTSGDSLNINGPAYLGTNKAIRFQ